MAFKKIMGWLVRKIKEIANVNGKNALVIITKAASQVLLQLNRPWMKKYTIEEIYIWTNRVPHSFAVLSYGREKTGRKVEKIYYKRVEGRCTIIHKKILEKIFEKSIREMSISKVYGIVWKRKEVISWLFFAHWTSLRVMSQKVFSVDFF